MLTYAGMLASGRAMQPRRIAPPTCLSRYSVYFTCFTRKNAQILTLEVLSLLALLVQKSTNTDTLVAERDLQCENTAGNRAGALGYSLYLLYWYKAQILTQKRYAHPGGVLLTASAPPLAAAAGFSSTLVPLI